ncbi:hypothetical protein QTP70_006151 [Hemibagrus guttatus]|uniref:Uncharacterized protein n=1 Tax=Hemibagrus guttatus TaxID=175788 RepID=A0AAE0RDE1_9TELE|nr:hypothetical protein QTP70_006151 [Hemibagrus guttatus]
MLMGHMENMQSLIPLSGQFQINAEFLHITTLPLQPRYLASLNGQSSQFLHIIKSKGGAVREKTKDTIKVMADQREEAEREFEKTTMVVFVIHEGDALSRPLDIAIVIDGVECISVTAGSVRQDITDPNAKLNMDRGLLT